MFMIITKGWGWLFIVGTCLLFVLGVLIGDFILNLDMGRYAGVCGIIVLLISAVAYWFIGKEINKERIVDYDAEDNPITQKNQHTIYYIPVQYFSIVLLVAVVLILSLLYA